MLSYRINNGPTQTVGIASFEGRYGSSAGSLTANDSFFSLVSPFSVTAGQTLTFLAGTSTYTSAGTGFSTPPSPFTGNAFVTDANATALSNLGSVNTVPEPSAWTLLGLGATGLGLAILRRRAAASACA